VVFGLKKYRQHLLGRPIIVRADHAALTFLMKMLQPIGQQARWLDLISRYDFTIHHCPGRVHGNSDTLSRLPCVSVDVKLPPPGTVIPGTGLPQSSDSPG